MTYALDELSVGILVGIGCVQAVYIRQEQQAVCTRHLSDTGGKPVVIAITNLSRGYGVVLINDGHCAELEQCRVARALR